ncbi:TPA: hypothetical protein ACQVJ5_002716 [Serratia marcescens]|uniref:hypothetical protein n=1 Tax=Serratia TaxID=613 RepID=UPI001A214905|nr:hypothetical protein [Serratia nevei]HAU4401936.1 hypothetical protein [Serratia marcescens]MDK5933454.1 hypothetical protein [Serratia nevei]MEC5547255.1 hypothetical protein [Serratia nevei]MEC5626671.1 hypothetical protein [Serratia nevei]MEC5685073.1 hypothetical protein [Serratia nevei]
MNIQRLLEAIADATEGLDRAKRIVEICDGDVHKVMIFADPVCGMDCRLPVEPLIIRELAMNEQRKYEAKLATLNDAKTTAERVIAGLLPDTQISA